MQSLMAGALAGLIAVGALFVADVGGIGRMILHDPSGWIALSLLSLAFTGSFGLAAVCTAIAQSSEDVTTKNSNPW
jgi:hypothetical protein